MDDTEYIFCLIISLYRQVLESSHSMVLLSSGLNV